MDMRKNLKLFGLAAILGANLIPLNIAPPATAQTTAQSSIGMGVAFTCNDSEATIKAKNGPRVTYGSSTIYIGYQQVTSLNKDPRIVRFDNGVRKWCRSDYETTLDDGAGYGLFWNGTVLYGVFSSTGTQIGLDFRRFATSGWLTNYGFGGGAKVAVLARINPVDGTVNAATFVSSKKPSDGKTNSLVVKALSWNGSALTVNADSWWTPRRVDRNSMNCTGASPFKYTLKFSGDLKTISSATAVGCS